MSSPKQSSSHIRRIRRHAARVALAVTIVSLQLLGSRSAQGQTYSVLYSFKGGTDGSSPEGNVLRDAHGNLYGTTSAGGDLACNPPYGCGTVFALNKTGNKTVLYNFTGINADGCYPDADLVIDAQENLYSTAGCGTNGYGMAFEVLKTGGTSALYSFAGGHFDGAGPVGGFVGDAEGRLLCLCGPTVSGGFYGAGVVYSVSAGGVEAVWYNFEPALPDAVLPSGGLVVGNQGMYGTSTYGGSGKNPQGTVYELGGGVGESLFYTFTGKGGDGAEPRGRLAVDTEGNLYGTTQLGGDLACESPYGCGIVFKLDTTGKETVLHTFSGPPADGFGPLGDLAMDKQGNLYGTTLGGGSYNQGTVFKVNKKGKEKVLHSFTGTGGDGADPYAGIVRGRNGVLYGITLLGGDTSCNPMGCGTVFELTP